MSYDIRMNYDVMSLDAIHIMPYETMLYDF